jgi:CcmD family protein
MISYDSLLILGLAIFATYVVLLVYLAYMTRTLKRIERRMSRA